jgi:hypothetical protein
MSERCGHEKSKLQSADEFYVGKGLALMWEAP